MIASSQVESANSCIKRMLFNSDVSLCELMNEIHKLLDEQDKKNRYQYWKLAIPSVKNQEQANFLFTRVDKSFKQWESTIDESYEEDGEYDDNLQATIDQLIEVGGQDNIKETWEIKPSTTIESGVVVNNYLCAIDKKKQDFLEQRMNILDKKIMYDSIKDEVESDDESEEELDDVGDGSNEEVFQLQNPKIRRGKGRPAGTRRYKASYKKKGSSKTKQRRYKKCGQLEHYQKNCNA
ncbi:unnamed protein product [Rhizophagus irregularis]|nr:unnamed protein product [Rhizophagus irregularis]